MEFIEGRNLKQYGLIDNIYEIRDIFLQVGKAIEYCHNLGVIHSDIKPENIMIDKCGSVKLIDFGLSYLYDPKVKKFPKGTPLYFAPEEFRGDFLDYKIDVYAFGVTIYESIVGNCPHDYIDNDMEELTYDDYKHRVLNTRINYRKIELKGSMITNLLKKLLTNTPIIRLTMSETLNNIFFTSKDIIY